VIVMEKKMLPKEMLRREMLRKEMRRSTCAPGRRRAVSAFKTALPEKLGPLRDCVRTTSSRLDDLKEAS
jgi:hypothetical protein